MSPFEGTSHSSRKSLLFMTRISSLFASRKTIPKREAWFAPEKSSLWVEIRLLGMIISAILNAFYWRLFAASLARRRWQIPKQTKKSWERLETVICKLSSICRVSTIELRTSSWRRAEMTDFPKSRIGEETFCSWSCQNILSQFFLFRLAT